MDVWDVLCCVEVPGIIALGETYCVVEWVQHKYGLDPAIICDDGKTRVMWRGLFHD